MVKIKVGYKKTAVGVIPEEWEVKSLKTISTNSGDYGIGAKAVDYIEGKPRYLRITDIDDFTNLINSDFKTISEEDYDKYLLSENDLVFARTGNTTGKIYLYNPKDKALVFAGFLIRFSINERISDSNFIKQFCQTKYYWDWVKQSSTRSGQPGINSKQYGELLVPQPPLPEQQRIAEILSSIDEHFMKLDKTIEDYQHLKKGMMKQLLTEGIGHTEFQETEIGRIPKAWEVVCLGDVTTIIAGQSPSSETYNGDGVGLPFYQGKTEFGRINPITKKWCSEPVKIAEPLDILISVRAPVGEVNICREKSCIGRGLGVIRQSTKCDFKYIFYLMQYSSERLNKVGQGSTFTAINTTDLKNFKVQLPEIKEQIIISNILLEIDNRVGLYINEREDFIQLKKALMEQLLTGKIRTIEITA